MPDREKVIKAYEDFVNGYECFCTSDDYEYEMHKAVLALLKEQEHKDKMFHALEDDWKRLNDLLKEQNAVKVQYTAMGGLRYGACPQCGARIENLVNPKACGFCGQAVKWE